MKPVTSLLIEAARENGSSILFPSNIYQSENCIQLDDAKIRSRYPEFKETIDRYRMN